MDTYAVFGNPIAQSKSPAIHRMFAEQTGQTLSYSSILGSLTDFSGSLDNFFRGETAKGCNITMPFKQEAALWVDSLSDLAKLAGAVNTIIRTSDGMFIGDNTDGIGLVFDLQRFVTLSEKKILLLGAGGAARGVILPLLQQGVAQIDIANRTKSKALELVEVFGNNKVSGGSFDSIDPQSSTYDIIINSTSTSLTDDLPAIPDKTISSAELVYDMVYRKEPTVFLQKAQSLGVEKTVDGLGMLVGQAAQSFFLWRGVRPNIQPVLEKLRASL